jgi:broad specificity phosphatase PhoE
VLAVSHLVLSNEKKGLKALQKEMDFDEETTKSQSTLKGTRTIYFLRHGESQWNYVFNRGFGVSFPLRLARGLVMELMCLFNARNSFFVDAPLSDRGLEQVEELRKFLNKVNDPFLTDAEVAALRSKHVDVLRADAAKGEKLSKKSIIVTSNLRRAAHTAAIAFMDRFERTKEKLFVNDALQEMARNVDAFALAGEAFDAVPYTGITNVAKDKGTLNTIVEETVKFDVESNAGNKGIGRRGATDCLRFAHWATSPSAVPKECEAIIATGHSIYFKEFFKLFLPSASKHDAKSKKIVNCGVIAFELKKYEHEKKGVFYSIDENSIETVYGGFVQKGKH